MKLIRLLLCATLLTSSLYNLAEPASGKDPQVILHTSMGDITIRLYPQKAPITVANFLDYAKSGFYNNTIFHRVKKRFVIQGGGFSYDADTEEFERKAVKDPIVNESGNGLYNDRWTVAMARTEEPDSATSQFYINLRMNSSLDKRGSKLGYAVFGEVIAGQHVAQSISKQPTEAIPGFENLPIKAIILESVEIL